MRLAQIPALEGEKERFYAVTMTQCKIAGNSRIRRYLKEHSFFQFFKHSSALL